jgi:Protein of unknown function (DUF2934)
MSQTASAGRSVNRDTPQRLDQPNTPDHDEIAALAHRLWIERGCPEGSPEEDWLNAEQELSSGDRG